MNLTETNNPANYSSFEIGGLAYFLLYISDYLPYVIIYCIGTILGTIGKSKITPLNVSHINVYYFRILLLLYQGNLIIIATIFVNKELHSNTYVLILNLSFADLIVSGFVDSFSVIGII